MGCRKITYHPEGEGLEKSTVHFLGELEEKKCASKFCYNYYPFGLTMNGAVNQPNTQNPTPNTRLFNAGSELQELSNLYDTYYRQYDASLGRFNAIDPKASKYTVVSPYNYAFNDPIGLNDPLGDDPNECADCVEPYDFGWAARARDASSGRYRGVYLGNRLGATYIDGMHTYSNGNMSLIDYNARAGLAPRGRMDMLMSFIYGNASYYKDHNWREGFEVGYIYNVEHGTLGSTFYSQQQNIRRAYDNAYIVGGGIRRKMNQTSLSLTASLNSSMRGTLDPFPQDQDGKVQDGNNHCPCLVNLSPDNPFAFEDILKNMRYVENGGRFDVNENLTFPSSEKLNGGNWIERNIANPIGNLFNEAFSSFYTDRSGFIYDNQVYWRVFEEYEKYENSNIGYYIQSGYNPDAPSGYHYQIYMISMRDNKIILLGFKDESLYWQSKEYIKGK